MFDKHSMGFRTAIIRVSNIHTALSRCHSNPLSTSDLHSIAFPHITVFRIVSTVARNRGQLLRNDCHVNAISDLSSFHSNKRTHFSSSRLLVIDSRTECCFNVQITKDASGLGLSVSGGSDSTGPYPGLIRIKRLFPHQVAWATGLLQPGDVLLAANDVPLTNLTNYVSVRSLNNPVTHCFTCPFPFSLSTLSFFHIGEHSKRWKCCAPQRTSSICPCVGRATSSTANCRRRRRRRGRRNATSRRRCLCIPFK